MAVHQVSELSLSALDKLDCGTLVLFVTEQERPLRGASGLVDWRSNGVLSRLLLRGPFRGAVQEKLLTTVRRRVGADRILLVGAGPSYIDTEADGDAAAATAIHAVAELGCAHTVFGLPSLAPQAWRQGVLNAVEIHQKKNKRAANMTTWGPWRKL